MVFSVARVFAVPVNIPFDQSVWLYLVSGAQCNSFELNSIIILYYIHKREGLNKNIADIVIDLDSE